MKGDLAYCDELLFHDCCHIVRMLGDAMHTFGDKIPKVKFIYFSPLLEYETAQSYTAAEMNNLRARLEVLSGKKITDENLAVSIKLFNRQKKLLIELYNIRREYPGVLRGSEISNIVAAGMCMPKEDHIVLLERLLVLLEPLKGKPVSDKVRVVVHGSLCARCDKSVLDEIEATGGVIVDDDLYVGSKYFNTLYDECIAPMDALLKAYIHRSSPCPTRYEERNPGDYLTAMVKNADAKGIIMVVVKFCEAHDFLYFTSHRRFEELCVREMLVETAHDGKSEGQLKTRLQGFFESLEG
jgi:benzoyl-CoA reductase/2-hydroxyglutaryl-CoA dehydratase subunit BcrC/BadD/HgdB